MREKPPLLTSLSLSLSLRVWICFNKKKQKNRSAQFSHRSGDDDCGGPLEGVSGGASGEAIGHLLCSAAGGLFDGIVSSHLSHQLVHTTVILPIHTYHHHHHHHLPLLEHLTAQSGLIPST